MVQVLWGGAGASHFSYSAVPDPRIPLCQAGAHGLEKLWSPSRNPETILALGRKHMAHNHGNEYQVRTVHKDGTEDLSAWMNGDEQVARAVTAVHGPSGTAFWLRARYVLCSNCPDREQRIVECPLARMLSPRCSPHDSHYLVRVGLKNRHAVFNEQFRL